MFRFGSANLLVLYLLLPAIVGLYWFASRARRRAARRFGDLELVQRLSAVTSRTARRVKALLTVAAVALLVTALARPQFGSRVETVQREGQDIVVAIDVSASMLAEDITPNRLEKAKHAVGTMIDRLRGDRVGLVAFAGEAFTQAPLTVDYAAAHMFLNAIDPDLIPVPGTNLGEALATSVRAFKEAEGQRRILIVITDGEDHEGEIDEAVQAAVEAGVTIYTVGIGSTEGVPIPEFGPSGQRRGFKRDENGEVVTTRLEEEPLRRVADATGGRYLRASVTESELDDLADEIAAMDGRAFDAQEITQYEEQYQIFLGFALLLLTVEVLVSERRRVTETWTGRLQ